MIPAIDEHARMVIDPLGDRHKHVRRGTRGKIENFDVDPCTLDNHAGILKLGYIACSWLSRLYLGRVPCKGTQIHSTKR